MSKIDGGSVRLEDIAARLGVSRSEVSRALNGRTRVGKDIGPAMRERILAAAREMNYRPNRAAQSLARGRTDTVALMMEIPQEERGSSHSPPSHQELSPHYHEIVGALTYTLHEYGINLLLAQCGGPNQDPLEALEQIALSRSCDGIIITDLKTDDPRLTLLTRAGIPYVARGSSPVPDVVAVGTNNYEVGRCAAQHLSSLGHRRILFFNIEPHLMAAQGRRLGFYAGCRDMGIEGEVEYRENAQYAEAVHDAVMCRFAQVNPPTAIFAQDELTALAALSALSELRLEVPKDVSVMTCLNARFMRQIAPQLTVMNVHQAQVAAAVGNLMARILRGENVPAVQQFIQPELEIGKTTGPAAN